MNKFILSPSSLNVFIRDEASWVMRTFYKEYGESNIYAVRGILVEHCVNMMLESRGNTSFMDYSFSAILETISQGIEFDMDQLRSFYDWGIECYAILPPIYNLVVDKQIRYKGEIKGVKMAGYVDYLVENRSYCVDLKTVSKLPIIVSRGKRKGLIGTAKKENIRQMIIYRILSGKPQRLYYVDEQGDCVIYKVGYRDYKEHLPVIYEALKRIKYLLTLKIENVIIEVQPDEKKMDNSFSFDWSDNLRDKAKQIWSL